MFTKSIGRWGRSATQRPAPQAPAPRKHARNGRQALDGLRTEAPVESRQQVYGPGPEVYVPPAFSPQMHDSLEGWMQRCLDEAAGMDEQAMKLMDLAQRKRAEAAEVERLWWLACTVPGEPAPKAPQAPADGDHQADRGPRCFGCGRPGETRMCWNQLEGREVPLCPRCHPSADDVDEPTGADGEEPERVELPEALASEPAPATVHRAVVPDVDLERLRRALAGAPQATADTLVDLEPADGGERR